MFCTTADDLPARPRTRAATLVALCLTLLSAVAFGAFARPALAAEDGLLAQVPVGSCQGDTNSATDWGSVDARRLATACLINRVRRNAGLTDLKYCYTSSNCNFSVLTSLNPVVATTNASNLYTAAQWKAMDVDYGIDITPTLGKHCISPYNGLPTDDPHTACGRSVDLWPNRLGVQKSPGGFGEILAAGWPYLTPRNAVDMWLKSSSGVKCTDPQTSTSHSSHREILLCPNWLVMGVGASPLATGNIATGYPYYWASARVVSAVQFIR